jgi:hypothetical protein
MSTLDTIIATTYQTRDDRDADIYRLIGIDSPGAYAIREPDGRLMVWASEADSQDDDGSLATYRSHDPISDAAWSVVQSLALIDDSQAI